MPSSPKRILRSARPLVVRLEDRTVPASFQGLGFLPGGMSSYAEGLSADGSVVVGYGSGGAFRWTAAGGMTELVNTLPGGGGADAFGVSADGSTVVGGGSGYPWRWTAANGMVVLGSVAGYSEASGVSADGSVVAGTGNAGTGSFRWTESGGMAFLPLPPGGNSSNARGVLADGSIVGQVNFTTGQSEAWRWTATGAMYGLGYPPGGVSSIARSLSADGSVVVGATQSAAGTTQASRWTATTGMVGLGVPPGGTSDAWGVSADGSTVVGSSSVGAFWWTAAAGMRSLRDALISDYGLGNQLAGWTLSVAKGCSSDGRVFVGEGIDPAGHSEAWIARLDTPQVAPPRVQTIQINDGSAQRSRVTNLTVTFNKVVTLPVQVANAFQLVRQSDGAAPTLAATVNTGVTTSVTLTFSGNAADSGSLADGRYTLNVFGSQVSNIDGVANLDGNGDGTGGDDYTLIGDPATNKLFRLFGDANGSGNVDATDFGAFRAAFGTANSIFDFDGGGAVDANDFDQFRQRFGASI